MCTVLAMGLNDKPNAVIEGPNKNFYVYREPGLSDAEYEKIKRNMLEYRTTMDRILEAHYAPPNRPPTLQKEKSEVGRRGRDVQDPRNFRSIQAKHAKPQEKNRADSDVRTKGVEKSGRERQSFGRSREAR